MKIRTERGTDEIEEVKMLIVYNGLDRYRITETIDGRLCITKYSDGDTHLFRVYPRSGNEIEIN